MLIATFGSSTGWAGKTITKGVTPSSSRITDRYRRPT